jgi:hypothetical protein
MPEFDWQALSDARVGTDEAEPLIKDAVRELEAILQADPQAENRIKELLGRRLSDRLRPDAWGKLETGLASYMGIEPASLFGWLASGEIYGDRTPLEKVLAVAGEEAGLLLRSLLGTYGAELGEAWGVAKQSPHDWRAFFRDVYQDRITNTPFIRIRISKYNGEEFLLEGNAASVLGMARNFVLTLLLVSDPSFFPPALVQSFQEDVTKLLSVLVPLEPEAATAGTGVETPDQPAAAGEGS